MKLSEFSIFLLFDSLHKPNNTSSSVVGQTSFKLADAEYSSIIFKFVGRVHYISVMSFPILSCLYNGSRNITLCYWLDFHAHVVITGVIIEYCALSCSCGMMQYH